MPHAAGAVVLVAGLSAAVHLLLTGDPVQAMYLMLVLVAAGAVLPVRGWLLALDAVSLVAFAVAGLPRLGDPTWQHVAVVLLFSVAVAHLLHAMRGRALRRLDELTAALAEQATRDELTGLLNRRGPQEAGLPDDGDRAAGGAAAGVLYLDIDGFKPINDELGHAAGDAVLVEVADRLARLVLDAGRVARVGGDEFAVLLPSVDAERLTLLGHRVRMHLVGTAGVLRLQWGVSVGTALEAEAGAGGQRRLARSSRPRTWPCSRTSRPGGPAPARGTTPASDGARSAARVRGQASAPGAGGRAASRGRPSSGRHAHLRGHAPQRQRAEPADPEDPPTRGQNAHANPTRPT